MFYLSWRTLNDWQLHVQTFGSYDARERFVWQQLAGSNNVHIRFDSAV